MSNEWYYASGGVQQGPVGIDQLKAMHAVGQIPADALIWRNGMDSWKPWNEVPELSARPTLVTGGTPTAPAAPVAGAAHPYAPPAAQPVAGMVGGYGVKPPTYLWQSIACTILCCLPFGVVGIVYAAKVDSLAASGNMAGAIEASGKAKFWCWMSFGSSLVVGLLYMLAIAGGMAAA